MEVEPVEPVQMNIYQSNTYRKDLSWLNFDNEPRVRDSAVKEGPTVLHIHFSSLSNYLKSTHDNSIPCMTVWKIYRYRTTSGERNFTEQIKAPIFLETLLAIDELQ